MHLGRVWLEAGAGSTTVANRPRSALASAPRRRAQGLRSFDVRLTAATVPLVLLALTGCASVEAPPEPSPTPSPTPTPLPWVEVQPDICVARGLSTSTSNLQTAYDTLADLGVTSIRGDVHWHRVEASPGTFDFSAFEPVIDGLLAIGVEPISLLAYGNPWASSDPDADPYYPPDDPADFALYAGATAAHFAGRVARYEVWNEQNAGYRFWKPGLSGDPVAYGALFAAAADAIHAADPAAEVLIGGTFFHEQFIIGGLEFLAAMGPAAWAAADGLAFHPYTFYPPSVPPEYAGESEVSMGEGEVPLVDMIAQLRAVAADAGRPELPLVVTEFGWPDWGDVDAIDQADWAERSVLLGLGQGVGTWCGYTLFGGSTAGAEGRFGMAQDDGSLTPYGERMRDLAGHLAGVDAAAQLDLPPGQYGVALRGPEDTVRTIVWGSGSVELDDGTVVPLSPTPTGW